jgi:hypothetical protein
LPGTTQADDVHEAVLGGEVARVNGPVRYA